MALWLLEGQRMESVTVNPRTGATTFCFDLDCVLRVRRMRADGTNDVWSLTGPRGQLIMVYGNGSFERGRTSDPLEYTKTMGVRFAAPRR